MNEIKYPLELTYFISYDDYETLPHFGEVTSGQYMITPKPNMFTTTIRNEFVEELLKKLESSLGCINVALYIKEINKVWHSNNKIKFDKSSLTEYLNITKTVVNENLKNPIALVIPLYIEGVMSGILAFGTKKNQGYFSIEEMRNIDKIMIILAITVNRYTLYKKQEDFALILQKEVHTATKELKTKNELLVQKSQQERDMLDILGHELRTPLSIARNSIDIIKLFKKQNKLTPQTFEKYINMAQENVYREVKLLEVMLAATKLDNRKLNLELIKVDLVDVVDDTLVVYPKFSWTERDERSDSFFNLDNDRDNKFLHKV